MANKIYFRTTDNKFIDLSKAVPKSTYKHTDVLGAGAEKRKNLSPEDKVHAVMGEFKRGTLRSGSGEKVTDRSQAIAIAMSESGMSKAMVHDILIDHDMEKASQLKTGIKIESEHKDTIRFINDYLKKHGKLPPEQDVYKQIAKDHLSEFKDYYTRLLAMEKQAEENMQKARVTKYIKRVPKPSGKGYYYFYTKQQFQDYKEKGIVPKEEKSGGSVWDKLKSFFGGGAEEKVGKLHETVTKQGISITKNSLAEHLAEYLANKSKWDARFSGQKKEKGESKPKSETPKSEKKSGEKKEGKWNTSVMRFFSDQYGAISALAKEKEKETGSDKEKAIKDIKILTEMFHSKSIQDETAINGVLKIMKDKNLSFKDISSALNEDGQLYDIIERKSKSGSEKFKEAAQESEYNLSNLKSQKIVNFKGDDTDYHVVDSWKEDGKEMYRVVIDEKINQFDNTKDTEKREMLSEVIPASEFEDKKSPDNFETMPEGEKKENKSKSISASELFKIDNDIMDKLDVSSGGEVRGDLDNAKKYAKAVFDSLDKKGVTKLSDKIQNKLEDQNYHLLNLVLSLGGYYGEKSQEDSLNFVNKMKSEGKEYYGFPVSAIPGNKLFKDEKPSAVEALKDELGKKESNRLKILENSLEKKKKSFDEKLQNHFETVKQANGQPLNDKRNGRATLNKWDRQNDSLRKQQDEIEKTKNAIEREKNKIENIEESKKGLPTELLDSIESGTLIQWRKHPNTFFVKGVDKARIVWDTDKKQLAYRYLGEIKDTEQRKIFAKTYNELFNKINNSGKKPAESKKEDKKQSGDPQQKYDDLKQTIEKDREDLADSLGFNHMTDEGKFYDKEGEDKLTLQEAIEYNFQVGGVDINKDGWEKKVDSDSAKEIKELKSKYDQFMKNKKELADIKEELMGPKMFKALSNLREELMFKAQTTKYIKRIPNPKGKGYIYFYTQQQVKDYNEKGTLPDQKKEPEKKTEGGKGNIEILKESVKKVATILADALSARDAVQPTGQAVEQTGENVAAKSKEKKRLEENKKKVENKPEAKKPVEKPNK